MLHKRLFFITVIFFSLTFSLSAEVFLSEILKKSDLSVYDAISLNAGDIWPYSKGNNAFEARIGTELISFPKKIGAAGLSTTYYYLWTLGNREEIETYWIQGISEGFWLNFSLPEKFELLVDQSIGMGFSKIQAVSIDQKKINNYYNSFLISLKGTVYRPIFSVKQVSLCWNAGTEVRFFLEQDSTYANIGLIAGLTVKAAKK